MDQSPLVTGETLFDEQDLREILSNTTGLAPTTPNQQHQLQNQQQTTQQNAAVIFSPQETFFAQQFQTLFNMMQQLKYQLDIVADRVDRRFQDMEAAVEEIDGKLEDLDNAIEHVVRGNSPSPSSGAQSPSSGGSTNHSSSEKRKNYCEEHGQQFASSSNYYRHMREVHGKEKRRKIPKTKRKRLSSEAPSSVVANAFQQNQQQQQQQGFTFFQQSPSVGTAIQPMHTGTIANPTETLSQLVSSTPSNAQLAKIFQSLQPLHPTPKLYTPKFSGGSAASPVVIDDEEIVEVMEEEEKKKKPSSSSSSNSTSSSSSSAMEEEPSKKKQKKTPKKEESPKKLSSASSGLFNVKDISVKVLKKEPSSNIASSIPVYNPSNNNGNSSSSEAIEDPSQPSIVYKGELTPADQIIIRVSNNHSSSIYACILLYDPQSKGTVCLYPKKKETLDSSDDFKRIKSKGTVELKLGTEQQLQKAKESILRFIVVITTDVSTIPQKLQQLYSTSSLSLSSSTTSSSTSSSTPACSSQTELMTSCAILNRVIILSRDDHLSDDATSESEDEEFESTQITLPASTSAPVKQEESETLNSIEQGLSRLHVKQEEAAQEMSKKQ